MNKDDFFIIQDFENNKDKIYYKQWKTFNTQNLYLKLRKMDLKISYIKINGINYLNINTDFFFEYKQLLIIDWMKNVNCCDSFESCVKIKNSDPDIGIITIHNCNIKMFEKAIFQVKQWIEQQRNLFKDIFNFLKW